MVDCKLEMSRLLIWICYFRLHFPNLVLVINWYNRRCCQIFPDYLDFLYNFFWKFIFMVGCILNHVNL